MGVLYDPFGIILSNNAIHHKGKIIPLPISRPARPKAVANKALVLLTYKNVYYLKGVGNMKITVKAKNTQVTDALNDYIEKRFAKLEKYFTNGLEGTVTLIVERGFHRVEATIPISKFLLRAEEQTNDMYASIDSVVDKLERQIHKYKTRVNRKGKSPTFTDHTPSVPAAEPQDYDYDFAKAIKTKSFVVKPMDEEEAIMQMELIGHDFFVFLNAESDTINVVYKRHDGTYGLIQPIMH